MRSRGRTAVAAALPLGLLALTSCHGGVRHQTSTGPSSYAIGCEADLTGSGAATGEDICNAVIVAVQQINEASSLPYRLTVRLDDEAAGAQLATTRLTADEGVLAVIGPMASNTVAASGTQLARAHLAAVSVTATQPGLSYPTFFRTVADDLKQGEAAAVFLHTLNPSGPVVVGDDGTPYGAGFAAGVNAKAAALAVHGHDASAVVTKVQDKAAGAVLYGGGAGAAAGVAKALAAIHYSGVLITDDEARTPAFLKAAGDAGQGTYFTCACSHLRHSAAEKTFRSAYRDQAGASPDALAAAAYDATGAVVDALRTAGRHPTRAAVTRAIARVHHQGLTGTVKFGPNHEPIAPPITIYRAQNGGITYYAPAR